MKQAIKEIIRFPLRKRVLRGTFRGPLLRGAAGRGRRYARTRTEVRPGTGGGTAGRGRKCQVLHRADLHIFQMFVCRQGGAAFRWNATIRPAQRIYIKAYIYKEVMK